MKHHTQPSNPTLFDLAMIDTLSPPARLFAAAVLGVGTENPTPGELLVLKILGIAHVAEQHVAFAAYVRRMSIGQPAERLGAYLEPATRAKTLHHAWAAVAWLRSIGEMQHTLNRVTVH